MKVAAPRKSRNAIAEQRRKAVDEYGKLTAKLAPYRADLARLTDLAKAIRAWAEDSSPQANLSFAGNKFVCSLGPCGLESKITNMGDVYKTLGHEKFLKSCSMTLKALEAAGGDMAVLTVKTQTGTRTLTVARVKNERSSGNHSRRR